MAPKDYVARGRAPAKKTAPQKTPTKTPWGRIIVTLVLVAGFGYFLWSIKDSAPTPKDKQRSGADKQNTQEQLPEKPEEKWEFIEMLNDPEHTNVEVDVEDNQQPVTQYQMQCGSFRLQEQAEKMRAQIAFQGLESMVNKTTGSNGVWYRVVLGPYEGKRAAEKDRHILQRAKFNTCRIWPWK
ncbi:MAG: SPOR domain-containing protein [Aestuariibacter sp.]